MSQEMRPKDYLELGILYVREGRFDEAFRALRQAMLGFTEQRGHDLPYPLMAYYGLCLVVLRQDPPRGLALCKRAVDESGDRPEFYWALGKAYLAMRRKEQAITAFQHGLQIGDDSRLVGELRRLGIRNQPLIPFLPRENFLNRYLGILRAKSKAA